ncbi:YbcC family protein [Onishia taeanensis]
MTIQEDTKLALSPQSVAMEDYPPLTLAHEQALDRACGSIAPTWPLDRQIAVSPYWAMREERAGNVFARLSALGNIRCLMPPSHYLGAWQRGEISDDHLTQAAKRLGYRGGYKNLLQVVDDLARLPHWHNISDLVDARRDRQHKMAWRDEITHQISQFCAAYFQEDGPLNAERLTAPAGKRLYQHWRDMTLKDRGIAILMGEPKLRRYFETLPHTEEGLFQAAIAELDVDAQRLDGYAQALLLDINGWAAWVAYQDWQRALASPGPQAGESDMRSLLAIRLAWELVLWRYVRQEQPDQAERLTTLWHSELVELPEQIERHRRGHQPLWVWQVASELAYQEPLHQALGESARAPLPTTQPELQAAFCIDVRSEPLRRALEQQNPAIQTLGFAGFFGLPLEHKPSGAALAQPHLPGLLAPKVTLCSGSREDNRRFAQRLNWQARLQEWSKAASTTFTAVEAGGLMYAGKLLCRSLAPKGKRAPVAMDQLSWHWRDSGEALSLDDKAQLAHGILKAMGLTAQFAPRVLLVGHTSHSNNNPHAAGLECGACGGQSGEVSVRALARLLNEPALRETLAHAGLVIPQQTRFVPALHHTITDRIELPEAGEENNDPLSPSERQWLEQASAQARRERAPRLGLSADDPDLAKTLDRRGADWSQTRPEWGLANNASFIAAPRHITAPINLAGRSFLHDYDWRTDPDATRLEQIMTAPMVVAHWINMQYNSSVLDNRKLGSGNKVLHNVVGGHIGVFEGNGGDLRIGLPLQSLHDGEHWRHEPLRLSVYLAASTEAIEAIVARHEMLTSLVVNDWLNLFALDDETGEILAYRGGQWVTG